MLTSLLEILMVVGELFFTILEATFYHFYFGPPKESWAYLFHVCFHLIKKSANISPGTSLQTLRSRTDQTYNPPPKGIKMVNKMVPNWCREKSHKIIKEKITKDLGYFPGPTEKVHSEAFWKNSNSLNIEFNIPIFEEVGDRETMLFIHGGAHTVLSVNTHRPMVCNLSQQANVQGASLDYRLSPEHPFPCALEDMLAAYIYISSVDGLGVSTNKIVMAGDSSAGGLVASFLILLASCDGLNQPAGAFLISPWVDLTSSMPSFISNGKFDYLPGPDSLKYSIPGVDSNNLKANELMTHLLVLGCPDIKHKILERGHFYVNKDLLKYPLVSPLYSKELHKLPPILITTGECERLFDEGVLFARLINQAHFNNNPQPNSTNLPPVTLQAYQDMPHSFQIIAFHPAAIQSLNWAANFIQNCTKSQQLPINNFPSEKQPWAYRVGLDLQCSNIDDQTYFSHLDHISLH